MVTKFLKPANYRKTARKKGHIGVDLCPAYAPKNAETAIFAVNKNYYMVIKDNINSYKKQQKTKIVAKKPLFMSKTAFSGAPPGTRTLDPLIKSQLLYQLS